MRSVILNFVSSASVTVAVSPLGPVKTTDFMDLAESLTRISNSATVTPGIAVASSGTNVMANAPPTKDAQVSRNNSRLLLEEGDNRLVIVLVLRVVGTI